MDNYVQENQKLALELKALHASHHKVYATAESLTAGLIGATIVNVSGSSAWFDRGFITYSNKSKEEALGVKHTTLLSHGAVSRETALEMAEGAIANSDADIAVAVTGIAGPDGGSDEKPVGTVWIGICTRGEQPRATRFVFKGDREAVRAKTVGEALKALVGATLGKLADCYS